MLLGDSFNEITLTLRVEVIKYCFGAFADNLVKIGYTFGREVAACDFPVVAVFGGFKKRGYLT